MMLFWKSRKKSGASSGFDRYRSGRSLQYEVLEDRWAMAGLAAFRYASSSNTIYVTGPGEATLSQVKSALPNAPLTNTGGTWKLDANLRVEKGATLKIYGAAAGGDVNQLFLRSENSTASNAIVEIRADWGNIDIRNTEVSSWNNSANGPDTEYSTYKRAFIRVRSSLDADGVTPHESRMDVANSNIHHLGYNGSEAYGLVYKVIGTPGSNFGLYNLVNVYGNITNSSLHHNYFGMYSFGAFGMQILNNEVYSNVQYGLDPHDDSDSLFINSNNVHDNGNHGIICSQRCDSLVISNNQSNNNAGNGIMLHRNVTNSILDHNTTNGNGDSGIAIFDSKNNRVTFNLASGNVNGIRLSVGAADNVIEDNSFVNNSARGVNTYQGSDAPSPGDDGRPKRNQFRRNTITGNKSYGIRLQDSDSNLFEFNTIGPNGSRDLRFERSTLNTFRDNTVSANTKLVVTGTSTRSSVLYVGNQPGILTSVDSYSTIVFLTSNAKTNAQTSTQVQSNVVTNSAATSPRTNRIGA